MNTEAISDGVADSDEVYCLLCEYAAPMPSQSIPAHMHTHKADLAHVHQWAKVGPVPVHESAANDDFSSSYFESKSTGDDPQRNCEKVDQALRVLQAFVNAADKQFSLPFVPKMQFKLFGSALLCPGETTDIAALINGLNQPSSRVVTLHNCTEADLEAVDAQKLQHPNADIQASKSRQTVAIRAKPGVSRERAKAEFDDTVRAISRCMSDTRDRRPRVSCTEDPDELMHFRDLSKKLKCLPMNTEVVRKGQATSIRLKKRPGPDKLSLACSSEEEAAKAVHLLGDVKTTPIRLRFERAKADLQFENELDTAHAAGFLYREGIEVVAHLPSVAAFNWEISGQEQQSGYLSSLYLRRIMETARVKTADGIMIPCGGMIFNAFGTIRRWAKLQGVTGVRGGYLSNFALAIMFAHYLVQEGISEHVDVADFTKKPHQIRDMEVVTEVHKSHLPYLTRICRGFFRYYADFPWNDQAVSPDLKKGEKVSPADMGFTPRLVFESMKNAGKKQQCYHAMVVFDPFEGVNAVRRLNAAKKIAVCGVLKFTHLALAAGRVGELFGGATSQLVAGSPQWQLIGMTEPPEAADELVAPYLTVGPRGHQLLCATATHCSICRLELAHYPFCSSSGRRHVTRQACEAALEAAMARFPFSALYPGVDPEVVPSATRGMYGRDLFFIALHPFFPRSAAASRKLVGEAEDRVDRLLLRDPAVAESDPWTVPSS
ncbi:terminal uridylyltransferase 3 [Diplonema papillatum]|nr:terminal uridylyltransferase 3 [Diplonema papillatum]